MGKWTTEQEQTLREKALKGTPVPEIARHLQRTYKSVQRKLSALRLKVGRQGEWDTKEDTILHEHYGAMSSKELQVLLPGRTIESIYSRARALSLQHPDGRNRQKATSQEIKANAQKRYDKWRITDRGRKKVNAATIRHRYGSLEAYDEKVKNRRGKDGRVYDSIEEALVANVLYDEGFKYERNKKKFGRYVPDFLINDEILVEYFGLLRSEKPAHQDYKKVVQNKIAYYTKKQYRFVSLYPEDLQNGTIVNKIREVL